MVVVNTQIIVVIIIIISPLFLDVKVALFYQKLQQKSFVTVGPGGPELGDICVKRIPF